VKTLPLLLALLSTPLLADVPRIVPCDQPVKSTKRGLCINEASAADFLALAPSVSWYYSWHFAGTNHAPVQAGITFIPMAWGAREADLKGLAETLTRIFHTSLAMFAIFPHNQLIHNE
jgi:hypothetical protein